MKSEQIRRELQGKVKRMEAESYLMDRDSNILKTETSKT